MSKSWPWEEEIDRNVYSINKFWPKISIVTPSYNQGNYLEETILSVINQNYPNLEFIIIDGGSTDCSQGVIERYQDKLTYWISERDKGQTDAINKGLKKATGEIIGYLNSDDCLLPEALYTIALTYLRETENGLSKAPLLLSGNSTLGTSISNPESKFESALKNSNAYDVAYTYGACPQPSTFWTRTTLTFDENLKFCMDFDFWFKLVKNGHKVVLINKNLSFYRIHDEAKGSTIVDVMWAELAQIAIRHAGSFKGDIYAQAYILKSMYYKLRSYLIIQIQNEAGNLSKKALIKLFLTLYKFHPQICINKTFIKFSIVTIRNKIINKS